METRTTAEDPLIYLHHIHLQITFKNLDNAMVKKVTRNTIKVMMKNIIFRSLILKLLKIKDTERNLKL